jgi:thiol-disulfide isomerase/thioredoxin
MSRGQLLRVLRVTAVLGCCALAGLYAGRLFWADVSPPSVPAPTDDSATATRALVKELPAFILTGLDGQPRNIREWTGRPLLINFWATWCAPCRREMPLLQTLHEESPGGLRVIGIAVDRMPAVASYIAEVGVTYPILVGEEEAMAAAESFGPDFIALPFSVLVAADGAVLWLEAGELDVAELRALARVVADLKAGRLTPEEARERFPDG